MTTLSRADPSAEIACTLPVNEAGDRLNTLQAIIGDHLDSAQRDGDRLNIRIDRAGDPDLEAKVTEWAEAEKGCCAFLGFAIESEPETVTLEIAAPGNAAGTLDGIEWLVRAAGRGVA
jgi:hypothetical protein